MGIYHQDRRPQLARFVKDQLELEDAAKTPVVSVEAEPTAPRLD